MSASSGNTSTKNQNAGKQPAGSASYNVLNINDLYRGKSLEPKPTGSVAKHGMQTIGKIKNLTRIPAPDNSPASSSPSSSSVLRESSSESSSIGIVGDSSGWSKGGETGLDPSLSRTQVTTDSSFHPQSGPSFHPQSGPSFLPQSGPSFHPARTQSGPSQQQSMVRGASASATPSPGAPWSGDPTPSPGAPWSGDPTPSPGAPWSGDPVPCGPIGSSYLNPEFPDLDSSLSLDPKQTKGGAVAPPQLRPQIPPGGANWTQGMANVGKQVSGNGANGQFAPRGRPSATELDSRSTVRNSDLKSVGVLAPSKIEELDKISKESTGLDWSADLKFDFDQKLDLDHEDENYSKNQREKEAVNKREKEAVNQREKEAVNQREKEAADLELVNSDRPKVEGPHRPLFDPNDSRTLHPSSQNVRHQEAVNVHQGRSGERPMDDRFKKNVPHSDNRPLPSSSSSSSDAYGGNRNFNKSVQQIPPRFQKQFLQGQRQPMSNQSRTTDQKSSFEGIRGIQSNYQDSRTSQDSRTIQDSRTSQDTKTNEMRQGWRSETSNFQILQKPDMAGKPVGGHRVEKFDPLPAPMGNWADIMDSDSKKEVEPVKAVNREEKCVPEKVREEKGIPERMREEKGIPERMREEKGVPEKVREELPSWRSSMPKRVEHQPSVKCEEKVKEETVIVKRVITKPTLPVKEESKIGSDKIRSEKDKSGSDKIRSDKTGSDASKKSIVDESKNPKILLGPPPSIPAFGGSRSSFKDPEEQTKHSSFKDPEEQTKHDSSRMEGGKNQEQKHRSLESGPFSNNRHHPDRRVQYSDHRDNRNNQRPDYHANRRLEEKGPRYQDQKAVSQGDRRSGYQEDRRQEDRRQEDRRTGHQEDRRTGHQEDRRTGHQEDRRTGHQEDRRSHHDDRRTFPQNDRRQHDDRRPGHHEDRRSHNDDRRSVPHDDRRSYKSEKAQKSAEADAGTEIWETASENSHKDDKKQDGYKQDGYKQDHKQDGYKQDHKQDGYRGVERSKDHRRQDRNDSSLTKPRSDSYRDSSDKWKQSQPQRSDHREQRSDHREQRSYERDVNVHRSSQRKISDPRADTSIRRRDEKESSRKTSKDSSFSQSESAQKSSTPSESAQKSTSSESAQKSTPSESALDDSVTQSLSKMSLKDKSGSHEGELSDDGFQRVDRSKKRAKTAGEQQQPIRETDPESSHLRKHSKTVSRFPKSKQETSSSKLDKLSEEAFCSKSGEDASSNRSSNAWNKPLNQVPPTSGAIPDISKIRGSRTGKSGSFEHQDSGVDINSDHPTSTTSSQRSSPGEHARRAAGLTGSRPATSATTVTIPKTLNENVAAEESPPPVGTVIFENRNLRAENEALNNKRPDQHQVPQRSLGALPETRRAITGSASSPNDHKVQNARFEVGHFDASKEGSLKEEFNRRDSTTAQNNSAQNNSAQTNSAQTNSAQTNSAQTNSAQDLDQKIASVKKVWEDPVPLSLIDQEQPVSLFPESKSPPRQSIVNPSLAPGYKSIQPKQVAVAYPMTSAPNHTPSPPVIQPSQISSPPLDPLRHSMMGYPTHVSTPPGGHLYNTQAANFYQQFGQHMYPFSTHQNAMSHAFSSVLNQGVLNQGVLNQGVLNQGVLNQGVLNQGVLSQGVLNQGFSNMVPNHYQNPVQYQMQQQMKAEGGGNPMGNSLSQNNSYFQHQNHSYYQQPTASMHQQQQQQQTASMHQQQQQQQTASMHQQQQQTASMHQQQQSYGVPPGHPQSGQQYRQSQPVSMARNPSLDTSNGSSSVMRMNNQVASNNSLYNTASAEVFQKLFLQHQAMSQAATAIVGRGQGNAKVSQPPPGQVPNQYNQQRPIQIQHQSMQRSMMPSPSAAAVSHQSMPGMNQIPSSSFPQPIQRPTPAGPSMGMTAQYSQKGSGSKMSNRAVVSGQNVAIDAAKQREDAIRSTEFFFASTRDPSTVDGKTSSEPTSLE